MGYIALWCVKENKIIENREQPGRAVLYFLFIPHFCFSVFYPVPDQQRV